MMKMRRIVSNKTRGFTLIELAIVLAVTSLLTAGLWRMMSSGNTQLRDQAAADKQRELITSIRGYLASLEGQAYLKNTDTPIADGSVVPITLPAACPSAGANPGLCNFLSTEFVNNQTNSYGQSFEVRVRRQADAGNNLTGYSFMIKAAGPEAVPDTSGGRISSLIGNDGGFVYSNAICGAGNACGSYGTWAASPTADYTFGAAAAGQVASRTFVGMNADTNTPWLARLQLSTPDSNADGIGDFNTINTALALGGNIIYGTDAGGTFGGELQKLSVVSLGRTAALGAAPLSINGSCTKADIADTSCDNALTMTGDMAVEGLISVTNLYAQSFVYDSNAGTGSDFRLKQDIAPIDSVLEKMSKLNGYSFVMKTGGKTRFGVIAQEVEKVFPSIVTTARDGYKTVDYMGLVGPLVQSVNQLTKQNSELKGQLEEQARSIKALQKKIDEETKTP